MFVLCITNSILAIRTTHVFSGYAYYQSNIYGSAVMSIFFWTIVLGRTVLAYNSLFVALTRYLYIVHARKANQWDFEVVGRRFQIASISFPMIHVIIFSLTLRARGFFPSANHCLHMTPVLINFTMKFLSENIADIIAIICTFMMVFVYLNLAEGYLYIKIFQTIKR